jgi:hypothetical protein
MRNRVIAAIVGGVWLSAIGTTVAAAWAINRPLALQSVSRPETSLPGPAPRQAAEETAEPPTLEMPMVTIVGHYSSMSSSASSQPGGVAEMQAGDPDPPAPTDVPVPVESAQ